MQDLLDLINAANFLHIPTLLDLACAKVASLLKTRDAQMSDLSLNFDLSQRIFNMVKGMEKFELDISARLSGRKAQKFIDYCMCGLGCANWARLTTYSQWMHVKSAMERAPTRAVHHTYATSEDTGLLSPPRKRLKIRHTPITPEHGRFQKSSGCGDILVIEKQTPQKLTVASEAEEKVIDQQTPQKLTTASEVEEEVESRRQERTVTNPYSGMSLGQLMKLLERGRSGHSMN